MEKVFRPPYWIKEGVAVNPIANKLMTALQRSNSPRLQKIWKTKIDQRRKPETKNLS